MALAAIMVSIAQINGSECRILNVFVLFIVSN